MSDRYFVCHQCRVAFPRYNSLVMHYNSAHRGDPHPSREECLVEELPEGYTFRKPRQWKAEPEDKVKKVAEGEGVASEKGTVYREMPEPSNILYKILSQFPGLTEDVVGEVMSWVEYKGVLHPMEVSHLLTQMAGVPKGAANIVSQKYQLALQKAAQEGNANIQMTLAGWQYSPPQMGQFGGISTIPGMIGQPGGQYGQPPYTPPFGQPQMGYPPNQPLPGYYPYQPPPYRGGESEDRFDKLGAKVDKLGEMFEYLHKEVVERDEQKKEDALNARLHKIEESILALANRPTTGERDKEIEKLSSELAGVRQEMANNRIASLESKIIDLESKLTEGREDEIRRLREDLEETKKIAQKPVTGRTEMDIIGELGKEVLDKAGEAGRDVRAIAMSPSTRQQFSPERKSAGERAKTGEQLAKKVEREAEVQSKEDNYVKTEEVIS